MKSNQPVRATSVELFSREIKIADKDSKILSRDADNLYPLRIERVINNSPTARRCSNIMSKFIAGNGVGGDFIVNKKGETLDDIVEQSADCIAEQYGVYFLVKYGVDTETLDTLKITDIEVLDYVRMAKSKEDDDGFQGKFYQLEMEEKGGGFKKVSEKTKWYYPFNKDMKVILAQMRNDCKLNKIENPNGEDLIRHYRGQVYYLNLTPKYQYALPLVDTVYNDCDTEYRLSVYNNTQTRKGFLGQTVVVKFKDDEVEPNERTPKDSFNDYIKNSLGAENSANVLVVDVQMGGTDDLNKAFVVKQLEPQFDDKLFAGLEKSLEKKIMKAFNNIPEALVNGGDGALFSTNAETYEQMKTFYWEQNEKERSKLERALKLFGFDVKIKGFNE